MKFNFLFWMVRIYVNAEIPMRLSTCPQYCFDDVYGSGGADVELPFTRTQGLEYRDGVLRTRQLLVSAQRSLGFTSTQSF